jgi:hypothetical protein
VVIDPRKLRAFLAIGTRRHRIDARTAGRLYLSFNRFCKPHYDDAGNRERSTAPWNARLSACFRCRRFDGDVRLEQTRQKGSAIITPDGRLEQLNGAQKQLLRNGDRGTSHHPVTAAKRLR